MTGDKISKKDIHAFIYVVCVCDNNIRSLLEAGEDNRMSRAITGAIQCNRNRNRNSLLGVASVNVGCLPCSAHLARFAFTHRAFPEHTAEILWSRHQMRLVSFHLEHEQTQFHKKNWQEDIKHDSDTYRKEILDFRSFSTLFRKKGKSTWQFELAISVLDQVKIPCKNFVIHIWTLQQLGTSGREISHTTLLLCYYVLLLLPYQHCCVNFVPKSTRI